MGTAGLGPWAIVGTWRPSWGGPIATITGDRETHNHIGWSGGGVGGCTVTDAAGRVDCVRVCVSPSRHACVA
eukprot:36644-Eustigmatos_ZCMA.PRE.1